MKATTIGKEEGEERKFILKSSLYIIILLILRSKRQSSWIIKKLYDPSLF